MNARIVRMEITTEIFKNSVMARMSNEITKKIEGMWVMVVTAAQLEYVHKTDFSADAAMAFEAFEEMKQPKYIGAFKTLSKATSGEEHEAAGKSILDELQKDFQFLVDDGGKSWTSKPFRDAVTDTDRAAKRFDYPFDTYMKHLELARREQTSREEFMEIARKSGMPVPTAHPEIGN